MRAGSLQLKKWVQINFYMLHTDVIYVDLADTPLLYISIQST